MVIRFNTQISALPRPANRPAPATAHQPCRRQERDRDAQQWRARLRDRAPIPACISPSSGADSIDGFHHICDLRHACLPAYRHAALLPSDLCAVCRGCPAPLATRALPNGVCYLLTYLLTYLPRPPTALPPRRRSSLYSQRHSHDNPRACRGGAIVGRYRRSKVRQC